jgi:DNA-binding NtrC family response regulator
MTEIPKTALIIERDLFFVAKIREPLVSAGWEVRAVRSADDARARLAGDAPPSIVVVHFGVADVAWEQIIASAKAAQVPVLAYGSHDDLAAQQAARAAGATRVVANAKLAGNVLDLVERTINQQPVGE